MSDQLRDALTLAQEKRDRADVEHRLAALLHELASGADFACPPPRRLALHPRTTEKSFSAPAAPTANRLSALQLQEAWTRRGPRPAAGLTTSQRERTHLGRGCAARTARNIVDIVEETWWRRRESNPANSMICTLYHRAISHKSAIRRGRWVARVRYHAWRTAIQRVAWTNGTMVSWNIPAGSPRPRSITFNLRGAKPPGHNCHFAV